MTDQMQWERWFAWYPVETIERSWAWMRSIERRWNWDLNGWCDAGSGYSGSDGGWEYRSAPAASEAGGGVSEVERDAAWFALASGAAADIEQAAIAIDDPDAKRIATNAAAYVRSRCKEMLAEKK